MLRLELAAREQEAEEIRREREQLVLLNFELRRWTKKGLMLQLANKFFGIEEVRGWLSVPGALK